MTSVDWLVLVVFVLLLSGPLVLLPPEAFVLGKGSARFISALSGFRIRNAYLVKLGWFPWSRAIVAAPPPFHGNENTLVGGPMDTLPPDVPAISSAISWEDVWGFSCEGPSVLPAHLRLRACSPQAALAWKNFGESLRIAKPQQRVQLWKDIAMQTLHQDDARESIARFEAATTSLRMIEVILFFWVTVMLPVTVYVPLSMSLARWLVSYGLLALLAAFFQWRARSQIFPGCSPWRHLGQSLAAMLSPGDLSYGSLRLGAQVVGATHPIATAKAIDLNVPEDITLRMMRGVAMPIGPKMLTHEIWRNALRESGLSEPVPPLREDDCHTYCPRCGAQYRTPVSDVCETCPDILLETLS